jgi:hypothetical protein
MIGTPGSGTSSTPSRIPYGFSPCPAAGLGTGHGTSVAIPGTAWRGTDDIRDLRALPIERGREQVVGPAVHEGLPESETMNRLAWNTVGPDMTAAMDATVPEDPDVRPVSTIAWPEWYRLAGEPGTCGEQLP